MSLADITRKAVIAAISEFNELGTKSFLEKYRYQDARQYFLVYENREYPSKAIAGVAHQFVSANREPLSSSEFSGGENTVVRKLRELGFFIRSKPGNKQSNHSYWWVNHKQTYKSEVLGGYIWSPKHNKDGSYNQTYENLKLTKPGDIVFSYANAKISAIGVVVSRCMDQSRPVEFGKAGDTWSKDGWMVKIKWHHILKFQSIDCE